MVAADATGADQVWPDTADASSLASAAEPAAAQIPTAKRAGIRGRLRQTASRLGWGVADQAVSSVTNAAVSIYAARELGAVQFGALAWPT